MAMAQIHTKCSIEPGNFRETNQSNQGRRYVGYSSWRHPPMLGATRCNGRRPIVARLRFLDAFYKTSFRRGQLRYDDRTLDDCRYRSAWVCDWICF